MSSINGDHLARGISESNLSFDNSQLEHSIRDISPALYNNSKLKGSLQTINEIENNNPKNKLKRRNTIATQRTENEESKEKKPKKEEPVTSYQEFMKLNHINPEVYNRSIFQGVEGFLKAAYIDVNRRKPLNFTS